MLNEQVVWTRVVEPGTVVCHLEYPAFVDPVSWCCAHANVVEYPISRNCSRKTELELAPNSVAIEGGRTLYNCRVFCRSLEVNIVSSVNQQSKVNTRCDIL